MTLTLKGAVQKIQTYATNVPHCPCSNHALDLSISRSSSVQAIGNSIGLMKEVIGFFFFMSSKRNCPGNYSQRQTTAKELKLDGWTVMIVF